ncbi:MAG: hypothetical protein JJD95_17670 [Clostridium sp.]|nr:hypothetical protein [Clostridium sp.]
MCEKGHEWQAEIYK